MFEFFESIKNPLFNLFLIALNILIVRRIANGKGPIYALAINPSLEKWAANINIPIPIVNAAIST